MRDEIRTHKDLKVWKKSISLVVDIYKFTDSFPDSEKYNLSSQMQRATVSVPSNIAEGAARESKKEFIHCLYISLGSLAELETQIILSAELNYSDDITSLSMQILEIRKMILGLIKYQKSQLIHN